MPSKQFRDNLVRGHRAEDRAVKLLKKEFPTIRAVYTDPEGAVGSFKSYDLIDDYGYTFEVKGEVKSRETGNIAIEIESYGKPSGIESTEANEWFHIYYLDGHWVYTRCLVSDLRYYIALKETKGVRGGEDMQSQMYLFKAKDFSKDFGYTVFR